MPLKRDVLHVVGRLRRDLDGDASLDTLARRAGWSPFHLQRVFARVVGETPKRYALRGNAPALTSPSPAPGAASGGPAAVAVHAGPYDQLGETYAALERWIEANGLRTAGAPWESYITDPTDHPDPADWRTEIYWPVIDVSHTT